MKRKVASLVAANVQSLEDLQDVDRGISSLCLHLNLLFSLEGLQRFTQLTDVNLSCNRITAVIPIGGLVHLTSLNLANNLIPSIDCLCPPSQLARLFLQHNHISSLRGLAPQRAQLSIRCLDLRANCLPNLLELTQLVGLRDLKQLRLEGSRKGTEQLQGSTIARLAVAALLPQALPSHLPD